jgi:hypothetical protein
MKLTFRKQNDKRGSALVVTLFITATLLLGIASYLLLVRGQYVSVSRSQAWNTAMTLAESGVEEALAQLNPGALEKNINVDRTANGWGSPIGGLYGPMSRSVTNTGSYSVVFTDTTFPTIYATGYVTVPNISATMKRAVCVLTTNVPLFNFALAARTNIDLNGNGPSANSFNSSLASLSNNGVYDGSKTSTNGDVAVLYGTLDLGNHDIVGDVFLGPTATLNSGTNQVVGTVHNDYNFDFSDVVAPDTSGWFAPGIGIVGLLGLGVLGPDLNTYNYVFNTSGDYVVANLSGTIYVGTNAHVRLLVQNGSVNGVKIVGAGNNAGKLTMYVSAPSFSIGGNNSINYQGRAANFAYYGLPGNTSVTLSGNASFTGTFYAPDAALTLSGGGSSDYDFIGSCVAKSLNINGHFMFHFDEDLLNSGPSRGYTAVHWSEI